MGMIKVDEYTLKFIFGKMLSVIEEVEEKNVSEYTFEKVETIKNLVGLIQQERETMDIREILYQIRKNNMVKMKEAELAGDEKIVKECRKNIALTEKQISENKMQLSVIRKKSEEAITMEVMKKNREEERIENNGN